MATEPVSRSQPIERLCNWYIRHAGAIGVVYAVVPSMAWYGAVLASGRYREIYLLRIALSLVVGGAVGAFINRFGLSLWIVKHRSVKGPATLLDGAVVGAGVGLGCSLVAPLTSLIQSNDVAFARAVIIGSWLGAMVLGALVGLVLAAIGRQQLSREWPEGKAMPT